MLEENSLIPNLKCTAPCKYCYEENNVVLDMEYCTSCWQDNPKKYLYEETEYQADGSGKSTCGSECPAGFTSNGDTVEHVCTNCNTNCAECLDDGNVGDMDKCTVCRSGWKMYSPEQRCMESCSTGFYEVNSETCDKCSDSCKDCEGDKFNCIQCDSNSATPALFTSSSIVDGVEVDRSDCRAQCPSGYYMDRSDTDNIKCKPCSSPCSSCEGSPSACLTCDGTDNLYYVYQHACYEECPDSTAPDMSNLECVDCGENCLKCGISDEPSCFECIPPYLLEEGGCVMECQVLGNSPNLAKT